MLDAHIGNVPHGHDDADQADRHVDQKDPMPGRIGGNEAAERRAADRPDQRRHGEQRHGVEQRRLFNAAHHDEAADRRHHRAAHALNDARQHEFFEILRQCAADRAGDENPDGDTEHVAAAEAVRGPAARRNADRKRQQVRGDREFECQRAGAEVARDGRQGCRDDGRVHVLHEQRDGDDERNEAVIGV